MVIVGGLPVNPPSIWLKSTFKST